MYAVIEARGILFDGLLLTIELFLASAAIAIVMSIIAGCLRLAPWAPARWITIVYVEVFRGTSVVVQMFWLYFALPAFGITLDPFSAATVALGLCFGAYGSEVIRGAVKAVSKGQHEAATALNMSAFDRNRYIIFPQALAAMIPPYTNILILLLKATAAASLITIPELTYRANSLNQITFETTWIFATILVAYFVMAQTIAFVMSLLERYFGRWRAPAPSVGSVL